MEIKITVSFDAEALQVLNRLAIALKDQHLPAAAPAAEPVEIKPVIDFPAEDPSPYEEPAPAPAKEYTLEEIRSKVMQISRQSAEKKALAREALNKYADSVPHLKKADYAAFMADLEALA